MQHALCEMPIGFGLHLMSTILYQCVFLMGIGIERGDRLQSRTYILCLSMFWFWQRHITGMCLGIVRLGSSVWGPSPIEMDGGYFDF